MSTARGAAGSGHLRGRVLRRTNAQSGP